MPFLSRVLVVLAAGPGAVFATAAAPATGPAVATVAPAEGVREGPAPAADARGMAGARGSGSDLIFRSGFEPLPPVAEAWVMRHDGHAGHDEGNSIAVDADGNLFVAGYSVVAPANNQFVTIKYAPDGTQLWTATWDDPAGLWDEAYGVAADADGNAYVVGRSWGSGGGFDAVTIKYAADGTEQWVQRSADADYSKSIAVGPDGGIYVAGIRGTDAYVTIKYDPDGNEVWTSSHEDAAGADPNIGNRIAITPDGAIYVGGGVWSADFGSNGVDYLLIRYDADGDQRWVRRAHVDTAYLFGIEMAVDGAGNVFMAGGSDDYRVLKFGPDGDLLWDVPAGGAEGGAIASLATDAAGDLYAAGVMGCGGGVGCASLVKLDADGAVLWSENNPGAGGILNLYAAATVDAQGRVHAAGFQEREVGITRDILTSVYTEAGDEAWTRTYSAPEDPGGSSEALAIVVDGNGGTIVTGRSVGGVNETSTEQDMVTLKYVSGP